MKVLQDSYVSVEFHRNVMEVNWSSLSRGLNDQHFQHIIRRNLVIAKDVRPHFWLEDTREMHYLFLPDMQAWIAQQAANIFDQLEVKRLAFVLPNHPTLAVLIADTVNQMLDKLAVHPPVTRFFAQRQEALLWLTGDQPVQSIESYSNRNMGFA